MEESEPSTSSASAGASRPLLPDANKSPEKQKSTFWRQVFLGIVVSLPSVPAGMSFGFSAIALDELRLTLDEASWFASVTAIAFPLGALLVGPLMDEYGRRPALLAVNTASFAGWLMLSVHTPDPSLARLIAGRLLTGFAGGLASFPAAVYAAECLCGANSTFRSSLVAWSTVALCAGIFIVYLLGAFLPYYAVASVGTLLAVVSFCLLALALPESPVWLTARGRHGDAEWAQRRLGIDPPPSVLELPSASEAEDHAAPQPPPPPRPPRLNDFRQLAKPEAWKPLLIMTSFFFFQQFSGVYVMIAYMVDIVRSTQVVVIDPYVVTILAGTVILLVALFATAVYPKTGVRSIAAVSGAGTTITMIFIAGTLATRTHWLTREEWYFLNWVPFFAILANVAASTMGFLILPWSMLGEVFPQSVKGLAAGLATCFGYIFKFTAVKLYLMMDIYLGSAGVFFFYGGMAFLGTIFVLLFLPETKGRSLQEIVDGFSNKSKKGKEGGKKKTENESTA